MDPLTDHVVDTVAFVRYLQDRLPPRADRVFRLAEGGQDHLYLPQIALGEFIYIAQRGRLRGARPDLHVGEVVQNLTASDAFTISSMPVGAWEVFQELRIPELHDRMIAAEALARGAPLISNDPAFGGIEDLRVVW
ncbi:MAG: type II toxin-antitoxin system VapC family toxin [Thermoplasmata archaeon]